MGEVHWRRGEKMDGKTRRDGGERLGGGQKRKKKSGLVIGSQNLRASNKNTSRSPAPAYNMGEAEDKGGQAVDTTPALTPSS